MLPQSCSSFLPNRRGMARLSRPRVSVCSVPCSKELRSNSSARNGIRTWDRLVTNAMRYHLRHIGRKESSAVNVVVTWERKHNGVQDGEFGRIEFNVFETRDEFSCTNVEIFTPAKSRYLITRHFQHSTEPQSTRAVERAKNSNRSVQRSNKKTS